MKRIFACLFVGSIGCFGQSTISSGAKHSYAANAGWIDFRPSAVDGVVVRDSYISGKAYAANIGWIDFGDGMPTNGHSYSNTSAGDFGVNLTSQGHLVGAAYSANCGWITFEQSFGMPRVNYLSGKITGYAFSANLGWILLGTAASDLVTTSIAYTDVDSDGISDSWEMMYFSNLTTAGSHTDSDHDGWTDVAEYTSGTDPANPGSYFRILTHSYGPALTSATVSFTTAPNRIYQIEHNANLAGTWTDSGLGSILPDAGSLTGKSIVLPSGPARFIRAVAHIPLKP